VAEGARREEGDAGFGVSRGVDEWDGEQVPSMDSAGTNRGASCPPSFERETPIGCSRRWRSSRRDLPVRDEE